jgi:hypothetical protein
MMPTLTTLGDYRNHNTLNLQSLPIQGRLLYFETADKVDVLLSYLKTIEG